MTTSASSLVSAMARARSNSLARPMKRARPERVHENAERAEDRQRGDGEGTGPAAELARQEHQRRRRDDDGEQHERHQARARDPLEAFGRRRRGQGTSWARFVSPGAARRARGPILARGEHASGDRAWQRFPASTQAPPRAPQRLYGAACATSDNIGQTSCFHERFDLLLQASGEVRLARGVLG